MKLLIIGGNGMAGHMMVDYFRKQTDYAVFYTTRNPKEKSGLYLDARDTKMINDVIKLVHPDIVINCIGILNQHAEEKILEAYWINSYFPRYLKEALDRVNNGKLIHISTDCVFSGERGNYSEQDVPDGTSVYARTKALGEVAEHPHLTIRTSIVGPEKRENGIGLFRWFMQQKGTVLGYENVIWNGVTTLELAKAIHYAINCGTSGLLHLHAPEKISKYRLLKLFQKYFQHQVNIKADGAVRQDRTLTSTRTDFHYKVPDYETMIRDLRNWMCSQ